jgi:hypothetical protein
MTPVQQVLEQVLPTCSNEPGAGVQPNKNPKDKSTTSAPHPSTSSLLESFHPELSDDISANAVVARARNS